MVVASKMPDSAVASIEHGGHPALRDFRVAFRHPALQTAVHVEHGGYGISWNDNIDLSAEEVYSNGIDVDGAAS